MQTLQEIVDRCRRIAFFGGAGVSTASGIPDFRGKDGLYARRFGALTPEMMLSASFFYLHPDVFFDFYRAFMLHPDAKPNAAHKKLAELERAGLIYTQRTAGKFVTEDAAAVAAARRSLAEAQTRQYLAAMRALGCGKQEIHNLFDQMEEQEHADL